MSFFKRISQAFIWNHLNKIVGYLLDFLLSVVLARGLGNYQFGIYSELWNFVFLFSLIGTFGIDTAINVYLPKFTNQPQIISSYLRKTMFAFGLIACGVILLLNFSGNYLSAFVHTPELGGLLKLTSFYIVLFSFLLIAQMILISFYAAKFLFWVNSILKLATIIISYFILSNQGNLNQVIIGFIVINIIISGVYFIRFFKYLRPKPAVTKAWPYFKFGLVAWTTQFVNYLLGRYFDIFLLGYFAISKQEIGYYNIAFSITLALHYFFTSGFGGITTAAFSEFEQQHQRHSIATGWLKVTKVCIFFSLPVFLYVILNAKKIIQCIYTEAFLSSSILLQVFASFYLISVILGSGVNSSVLYAIRKEKIILYLRSALGLLNVILDILLIPYIGAMGAIIATGFATMGIISLEFRFVNKFIHLTFPLLFLSKITLASIVSLGIVQFISIANLFELILNGFSYVLLFLFFIFFLKPFSLDDLRQIKEINATLGKLVGYLTK